MKTCLCPVNDPNCFSNNYVSVDRLQFLIYSDENSYLVFNKEMCIINEALMHTFVLENTSQHSLLSTNQKKR